MATKLPLPAVMLNFCIGHWVTRLIYVAAKLKEFAEVFAQAGLRLTRVVKTRCPLSIVEGVRA